MNKHPMRRAATGIIIAVLFAATAWGQPAPPFDRPGRLGPRRPFAPPGGAPPAAPRMDERQPLPKEVLRPDRNLPLIKQIDVTIAGGVKYLLAQQRPDGSFDDMN